MKIASRFGIHKYLNVTTNFLDVAFDRYQSKSEEQRSSKYSYTSRDLSCGFAISVFASYLHEATVEKGCGAIPRYLVMINYVYRFREIGQENSRVGNIYLYIMLIYLL